MPRSEDPDLLVGFETADDAAVYRVGPETAIISTADYITPVVDDPLWFGRVAAANALSDVWAMGGRPIMALNLVNFPVGTLDKGMLREILKGGAEKVAEAGAALAGGHSVEDPEPKYGLAVTGVVHPDRVLTNRGARSGDALVLTKPLGSGVIFNANRAGKFPARDLEKVLPIVAALNRSALEEAAKRSVNGMTDITGFGFGGHALEMAQHSGVRLVVSFGALPFYEGSVEMYGAGVGTGSNKGNRLYCGDKVKIRASVKKVEEEMVYDPQTSGGLLISLPEGEAEPLVKDLHAAGVPWAAVVGHVEEGSPGVVITD
jgi:selenide,water dikinase